MEDDATVKFFRQAHQFFHDGRGLNSIVNISHQVFDTVDDADVGIDRSESHFHHLLALVKPQASKVESIEFLAYIRCLKVDTRKRDDAIAQNLLCALLTLFSIKPKHF